MELVESVELVRSQDLFVKLVEASGDNRATRTNIVELVESVDLVEFVLVEITESVRSED